MGSIDLEKRDGIAVVTISSPEVKNALTPEMGLEMLSVCDDIDGDLSIGCTIIRGADGTFCSGADRRHWDPSANQAGAKATREARAIYDAFVRIGHLKGATIAAVRGAAVGAGLNLMLATDLRIVADNAKLVSGFLRIGLHPGGGYFTISGRLAGREATSAMGLFGQSVRGVDAVRLGIAWEAVDDSEVDARALELASVAASDPELTREAVRSFRTELGPPTMPWESAVEFERATQMWSQQRRLAP